MILHHLLTKILPNFLTTHHWCLACSLVCILLVKELSDLGNGPNQPTATIIGEYSASYHHGTLRYSLWSLSEFILLTKILPNFLTTHHWCLACSQCVYVACEGLSDLGHGPHQPNATISGEYGASIPSWYTDTHSGSLRELIIIRTKILPNFLTTHHWCLACSQWCVCCLWRVVRPWSWPPPA